MSDQMKQPTSKVTSDVPAVSSDEARIASRRRLLRMGVKVAPAVVATLVGRQALACHCTIPSAWGSISTTMGANQQDMGNVDLGTGSISRYSSKIVGYSNPYEGYSAWNSSGGAGWTALMSKVASWPASNVLSSTDRKAWLQGTKANKNGAYLSAKALLSMLGFTAPSTWGNQGALATISSGGYKQAVLIAFLANKTGATFTPCLSLAQLTDMGNLTFKTSMDSAPWTGDKIIDYLNGNWMIRING